MLDEKPSFPQREAGAYEVILSGAVPVTDAMRTLYSSTLFLVNVNLLYALLWVQFED